VTRALYRSQWFELLGHFQENDERAAQTTVEAMMKAARSTGVRRLADYARIAVHVARRAEQLGRPGGARLAYDAAVALDDTNFDAAVARVAFFVRSGRFSEAFRTFPSAVTALFAGSESRLSFLSSLVLVMVGAVAAAVLATILALFLRHSRGLAHDLRETASRPFGHRVATPIAYVMLALPIFFALGPVWLLLYWAALAYAYCGRRERVLLAFGLLALGFAPLVVDAVARENLLRRSPIYLGAVDLAERREDLSVEDGLTSLALAYPDQPDAWFLLGRYAERTGDNARALAAYGRAIDTDPKNYRALVNRGNVRFLEGEYPEAISDYEEAGRRAPESAEAFYNLSVARSEIYDFRGQEAARARALQISRRDVDAWSSSPPLTRVVPASYRIADARENARAWGERAAGRPKTGPRWAFLAVLFSPWCLAPWGALLVGVGVGAIRSRTGLASECSRCGRPFCRRCKRHGGPPLFCARCVRLHARKEAPEEELREENLLALNRAMRRRLLVRFGSVPVPGLHRFLSGRPWRGFVLLVLFFFALALAVGGPWLFNVAPFAPAGVALPWRIGLGAVALVLWLTGLVGAWRMTRES
jgi:tetratricopeptide (TPR) repeat protein